MIGKTLSQATKLLQNQGITQIQVIDNFTNPQTKSQLLVTSCKIQDKTAYITLGSFKLDI